MLKVDQLLKQVNDAMVFTVKNPASEKTKLTEEDKMNFSQYIESQRIKIN